MKSFIKIWCSIACAILGFESAFSAHPDVCEINIKELNNKAPLFIKDDELMIPKAGQLKWNSEESTEVYCTDIRDIRNNGQNNFVNSNYKY